MNTQKLLSYLRQCIKKYNMIQSGDMIAVGLSGGKDSMTLLYGLKKLQAFYPESFTLVAIYVNLGINTSTEGIELMKNYCANLDVPFHVVNTDIYKITFEERKEKIPAPYVLK